MSELVRSDIDQYSYDHTSPAPELLQMLEKETYQAIKYPDMLTGRVEGRFLKMLVQLFQPKLIFEIGTFTGYSALSMAEGLQDGGQIITCEIDSKVQQIAQNTFDKSSHGYKVKLHMKPALEVIKCIENKIDMSFIDADRKNLIIHYEEVIKKTRRGGLIIIDNVLWKGEILNPQDERVSTVAKFNKLITNDKRVENVLLTVRDGIQLIRKI
ncbi:MAG: methyltransferase [bacterium]|nr:methyltransferase [bacterium]